VPKAIPHGVLKRLGRLTSKDSKEIGKTRINKLYHGHITILRKAKILPTKNLKEPPKLKEQWRKDKVESEYDKKKEKKYDRRSVYFVHGHSRFWFNLSKPLHISEIYGYLALYGGIIRDRSS